MCFGIGQYINEQKQKKKKKRNTNVMLEFLPSLRVQSYYYNSDSLFQCIAALSYIVLIAQLHECVSIFKSDYVILICFKVI